MMAVYPISTSARDYLVERADSNVWYRLVTLKLALGTG